MTTKNNIKKITNRTIDSKKCAKSAYLAFAAFTFFFVAPSSYANFSYRVDDQFEKPALRKPAPKDGKGDKPRDVLIQFLEFIDKKKYKDAADLCHFGRRQGDSLSEDWESIEGEEFGNICEEIGVNINEIVISGSTVKQNSGYYSIWCRFTDNKGISFPTRIYLLKISGVWKIREASISDILLHSQIATVNPSRYDVSELTNPKISFIGRLGLVLVLAFLLLFIMLLKFRKG